MQDLQEENFKYAQETKVETKNEDYILGKTTQKAIIHPINL